MTNIIIVVVIVVILFFALRSSFGHFKGEGSCCGGGTYKARKKKLDNVTDKKIIHVDGMTCQHCVNRVMEAVNSIEGASAVVHLKKGIVTVSMDHSIEDSVLTDAIERAGYTVTGIN